MTYSELKSVATRIYSYKSKSEVQHRNYFEKCEVWLARDGKVYMHEICNNEFAPSGTTVETNCVGTANDPDDLISTFKIFSKKSEVSSSVIILRIIIIVFVACHVKGKIMDTLNYDRHYQFKPEYKDRLNELFPKVRFDMRNLVFGSKHIDGYDIFDVVRMSDYHPDIMSILEEV